VPPPTEEQLTLIPGALHAWKGLTSLEFKACVIHAHKVIISPARLAAFQGSPLEVQDAVEQLKVPCRGAVTASTLLRMPH
jgi:hypothetical protein